MRIFMYPYPYVLHAKHLTVDDDVAVIGSSNMDIRSFNLDFEVVMMSYGESFVTEMRRVEDLYRSLSEADPRGVAEAAAEQEVARQRDAVDLGGAVS